MASPVATASARVDYVGPFFNSGEAQSGIYDIKDKEHLKKSEQWITGTAKDLKGNCLILGPGQLEISSIKALAQFGKMTLASISTLPLELIEKEVGKDKFLAQTCDLTGGLVKKINKFANRMMKDKPSYENPFDVAIRLSQMLDKFQPDTDSVVKQLGQADYIVSSNVGMQSGASLYKFICKLIKDEKICFHDLDSTELQKKFIDVGMTSHLKVIKALSKSATKVCLLDTLSYKYPSNFFKTKVGNLNFSKLLNSQFSITRSEDWKCDGGDKKWDVHAFQLENPKTVATDDEKKEAAK